MLDFSVKMARNHHEATQADLDRLRKVGFTDAEILYIVLWIANFNLANTITDVIGLGFHENFSANLSAIFVEGERDPLGSQPAATQAPEGPHGESEERGVVRALEDPPLEWINSRPLTWEEVRGEVLLVIYWDATHPNSLQAIPHLRRWHEEYSEAGLRVIAVHTGEFPFAKPADFVRQEVARLGIEFPVPVDPKYRMSAGANNRFWPALQLIDRRGFVKLRHYGPGGYAAVGAKLRALVDGRELGDEPERSAARDSDGSSLWLHPEATPELYVSYTGGSQRRGIIAPPGSVRRFDAKEASPSDILCREGTWRIHKVGLEKVEGSARISFPCRAQQIGVLASPGPAGSARMGVYLDGERVPEDVYGKDLTFPSDLEVTRPRFYELIRHPDLESHQVELRVEEDGAMVHRFSFLPALGTEDY